MESASRMWFRILLVGLSIVAVGASRAALAHEYWLERDADAYVLYQGHLYSAHEGEARVPYDPAILRDAQCLRASGKAERLAVPPRYPLRLGGACSAIFLQVASGYWSQTLTGTVNKPKTEVFGALRSWSSEESLKFLAAWHPALTGPLSTGLELVPLENLLKLRAGDKIRLLVTWQGKPKPGVAVAYDGNARGVTDDQGLINLRVRHAGTQVVSASFEEPLQDPRADKVVRATILQFELKE
jgi:nickel transport protein